MPVGNILLLTFPAEKDLFAVKNRREIDQSAVKIFDLDLAAVKFEPGFFDVSHGSNPLVDLFAAQVATRGH